MDPARAREFVTSYFTDWHQRDPEKARKAAFDYFSEERAMKWVWLVLSITLLGGLALVFLADGLNMLRCNRLLHGPETEVAQATITKIKKDRRGGYNWDLSFTTHAGAQMQGRRTAVAHEGGKPLGPDPTLATVVYAREDASCWDVSLRNFERALPEAQRRLNLTFTLLFGACFAVAAVVCTAISVFTLRRTRPHKEIVREIYETQLRK